jgi:hypothetical protein
MIADPPTSASPASVTTRRDRLQRPALLRLADEVQALLRSGHRTNEDGDFLDASRRATLNS